jgi:hypothetical protein
MGNIIDETEFGDYKQLYTKLQVSFNPLIKHFFEGKTVEPLKVFEYNLFTLAFVNYFLLNKNYPFFYEFGLHTSNSLLDSISRVENEIKSGELDWEFDLNVIRDEEYLKEKILNYQRDIVKYSESPNSYFPKFTYTSIMLYPNEEAKKTILRTNEIKSDESFLKTYYSFTALLYYWCTDNLQFKELVRKYR